MGPSKSRAALTENRDDKEKYDDAHPKQSIGILERTLERTLERALERRTLGRRTLERRTLERRTLYNVCLEFMEAVFCISCIEHSAKRILFQVLSKYSF